MRREGRCVVQRKPSFKPVETILSKVRWLILRRKAAQTRRTECIVVLNLFIKVSVQRKNVRNKGRTTGLSSAK